MSRTRRVVWMVKNPDKTEDRPDLLVAERQKYFFGEASIPRRFARSVLWPDRLSGQSIIVCHPTKIFCISSVIGDARSRKLSALPIGLANHVKLVRAVAAGTFVTAADVTLAENLQAMRVRREMEALAQDSAEIADAAVDAAVPNN